jgi:hypothetical protein
MAVDGNGGTMQPLDDEPQSPVAPSGAETPAAAPSGAKTRAEPRHAAAESAGSEPAAESAGSEPAAGAEREANGAAGPVPARRRTPMAAFDRVSVKWLATASAAVVLLIVAVGAVLLLGTPRPRTAAAPVPPASSGEAPSSGAPAQGATPGSSSGAPSNGSSPANPGNPTGAGAAPGGGSQPGSSGTPPASVDALKALLIDPPGTDSTVDIEPIDDTTFAGARWGVTLFWASPEGSMVLAQYTTTDEARSALTMYRGSVHDSGICDEQTVAGRPDAFLCAAKGLAEGVSPGDIPAIGLGLKGTIVALVTASDPGAVQQLLVKQLDRLP